MEKYIRNSAEYRILNGSVLRGPCQLYRHVAIPFLTLPIKKNANLIVGNKAKG